MTKPTVTARPAIATPESDAKLRAEYQAKGYKARQDGVTRDQGPAGGLIAKWWLEGWDSQLPPSKGPLRPL
jgi:hypothetical protein